LRFSPTSCFRRSVERNRSRFVCHHRRHFAPTDFVFVQSQIKPKFRRLLNIYFSIAIIIGTYQIQIKASHTPFCIASGLRFVRLFVASAYNGACKHVGIFQRVEGSLLHICDHCLVPNNDRSGSYGRIYLITLSEYALASFDHENSWRGFVDPS